MCEENLKELAQKGMTEANDNFRDLRYGYREPDPENETDNEMYWRGRRDAFLGLVMKKFEPTKRPTNPHLAKSVEILYHRKEE
jgi:hypothetical protein